jgi:hypothetical protein
MQSPGRRNQLLMDCTSATRGPDLTVPSPLPIGKSIAGPEVQEYKAVPVEIELADQTVKVMNAYRQARRQAEWS